MCRERRVGHYLSGKYASTTDARVKTPFPTCSTAPLEHRKEKKKILWKINHMLVLKLCQQSSQLWGCFKPILMETWGWGMGEGCIPFSDHRTEFFFFFIQESRKTDRQQWERCYQYPVWLLYMGTEREGASPFSQPHVVKSLQWREATWMEGDGDALWSLLLWWGTRTKCKLGRKGFPQLMLPRHISPSKEALD